MEVAVRVAVLVGVEVGGQRRVTETVLETAVTGMVL